MMIIFFILGMITSIILVIIILLKNSREQLILEDTFDISNLYTTFLHRYIDPVFDHLYQKWNSKQVHNDFMNYISRVNEGKNILNQKRLVIAGLIRNCESQVPSIREWYSNVKPLCLETTLFIVENDSIDRTRELLIEWSEQDPSVFILCPFDTESNNTKICGAGFPILDKSPSSSRIEKMAMLRNLYLQRIQSLEADYALIIDFDLKGTFYMDGLMHSVALMEKKTDMDAIACNGLMKSPCPLNQHKLTYYDSFAHISIGEPSFWTNLFDKRSHDDDVLRNITKKYVESPHLGLDKVRSAFGGLCLYRKSSLMNTQYGFSSTEYVCEHSILHKHMNIYVNPRMLFIIDENLH